MTGFEDSHHDLVREADPHRRSLRWSGVKGQPVAADVVGRRSADDALRTGFAQSDRHPRVGSGLVFVSRQLPQPITASGTYWLHLHSLVPRQGSPLG